MGGPPAVQVDSGPDLADAAPDLRGGIAANRSADDGDIAADVRCRSNLQQAADDHDVLAHLAVDSRGAANHDDIVDDLVGFDHDAAADPDAVVGVARPPWRGRSS